MYVCILPAASPVISANNGVQRDGECKVLTTEANKDFTTSRSEHFKTTSTSTTLSDRPLLKETQKEREKRKGGVYVYISIYLPTYLSIYLSNRA